MRTLSPPIMISIKRQKFKNGPNGNSGVKSNNRNEKFTRGIQK